MVKRPDKGRFVKKRRRIRQKKIAKKKCKKVSDRNWFAPEYEKWRKSVYARDNWTCQWPGCGLGLRTFPFRKIEAHHIYPWSKYPELRFDLNNGICLCPKHHRKVTTREEQFVEFFMKILKTREVLLDNGLDYPDPKVRRRKAKMLRRRNR